MSRRPPAPSTPKPSNTKSAPSTPNVPSTPHTASSASSVPESPLSTTSLESAFRSIAQSVAASVVQALVVPLRQEIESQIHAIIEDSTKDVHHKIAAALGQIQPIHIPINLFAQPQVQASGVLPVPVPVPVPTPAPVAAAPSMTAPPPVKPPMMEPEVYLEIEPDIESDIEPDIQPDVDIEPDIQNDIEIESEATLDVEPCTPATAVVPVLGTVAPESASTPPLESVLDRLMAEREAEMSTPPFLKKDPQRTPKKTTKNFTATIVGLKPGQSNMIKNEFKFARLSFVSADARNSTQLVALSKSNDAVVFMTDFVRHAIVECVRSVHGNWVYVSGGMSSLRDKLKELYQKHQQEHNPELNFNPSAAQ